MSRGHSSYQDYFQYDSVSLGAGSLVSCESSASLLHRVSPAAAPGVATPALSPGGGSYQGRGAQQVSPYNYAGQDTVSVVCRASRAATSLSMDNVHREAGAGAGASEEVRHRPQTSVQHCRSRDTFHVDFFFYFFSFTRFFSFTFLIFFQRFAYFVFLIH